MIKRSDKNINLMFFVGKVVSSPIIKRSPFSIKSSQVRIKLENKNDNDSVYLDVIAYDDNALILNAYAYIGNKLYLECHLENRINLDVNGLVKAKLIFVIDKLELLYKENTTEIEEPDLKILGLLDEIDPITYLEDEK